MPPFGAAPDPRARRRAARGLRRQVPRSSQSEWTPGSPRDPVAVIAEQERHRIAELLPIRHDRMLNFAAMGRATSREYGKACGAALARGQACSGDPLAIAAYLGKSKKVDHAIADFAVRYADQTERDHSAFVRALRSGGLARSLHRERPGT